MKSSGFLCATTSLFVAMLGLAVTPLTAQVVYSNYPGSGILGTFNNISVAQTFTGNAGFDSVSWQIQNYTTATIGLTAYVAEWNTLTNKTVASTLATYGTGGEITLSGAGGIYEATFTETITLNPSITYALILAQTTDFGSHSFHQRHSEDTGGDAFFSSGRAYYYGSSNAIGMSLSSLDAFWSSAHPSAIASIFDWTMTISQNAITPVPEPKNAAVGISAAFVGALMLRRRRRAAV